jgi:hypothetical protein
LIEALLGCFIARTRVVDHCPCSTCPCELVVVVRVLVRLGEVVQEFGSFVGQCFGLVGKGSDLTEIRREIQQQPRERETEIHRRVPLEPIPPPLDARLIGDPCIIHAAEQRQGLSTA